MANKKRDDDNRPTVKRSIILTPANARAMDEGCVILNCSFADLVRRLSDQYLQELLGRPTQGLRIDFHTDVGEGLQRLAQSLGWTPQEVVRSILEDHMGEWAAQKLAKRIATTQEVQKLTKKGNNINGSA